MSDEERPRRQQRELVHGSGAPAGLAEVLRRGRSAPPGRPRPWAQITRGERAVVVLVNALLVSVVLLVAAVLIGCGGRSESGAACAAGIMWNDRPHMAIHVADRPGPWPEVERHVSAYLPGCNDGGGKEDGSDVTLAQFRGIDAEVALAEFDDEQERRPRSLYLSPDFFLEVRSHPLHDQIMGPRTPDEARGKPCRPLPPVSGRVMRAGRDTGGLVLDVGERWRLDFRTRIRAPLLHGIPQPRPGQQVRVEGVLCGKTRRVARLIAVTS